MPVDIRALEFDDRNLAHLAAKGIEANLVWEVLLGEPRFFVEARPNRSGTHLMIGPSSAGRSWTIVLVETDQAERVWRAITGWPSTEKEKRLWQDAD